MQNNDISTNFKVQIRTFHPTDNETEQCYNVTRSVFKEYGQPEEIINKFAIEQDMSDIEENYLKLPRSCWWVATIGDIIIGQVGVQPFSVGDRGLYDKLMTSESARFYTDIHPDEICELRRMAVLSTYHNKHIGRDLLQTLMDFARTQDYKAIHLTTGLVMKLACRFYERCGFTRGTIHRYPMNVTELLDKDKKSIAVDMKKTDKITAFLGKPVIFNSLNELTEEDMEEINQPVLIMQLKSKYFYVQNFWIRL
jgi:GNAT superfamily N-acetyltransferase